MGRRKMATGTPMPKALACGMLEDEGRVLFLKKTEYGIERLEMPCVVVPSGRSPVAEIREKFLEYTGIDGEVHEIIHEAKYNAGSKRRKTWVPCLVFKITARERRARHSQEFSGFRWLRIEDAIREKLTKKCEWIRKTGTARQI
ncbi:NUDIX hydrolase [Candidatus Micrarchaeota archaeon]|nr:NUDIX hydrolase [Candidatus Micrarchaeota archaeon]